jgi:hypothetical protein
MRIYIVGKCRLCSFWEVVQVGYVQFAMAVGGVDDSKRRWGGDFDTEGVDERLTEITCGTSLAATPTQSNMIE